MFPAQAGDVKNESALSRAGHAPLNWLHSKHALVSLQPAETMGSASAAAESRRTTREQAFRREMNFMETKSKIPLPARGRRPGDCQNGPVIVTTRPYERRH